MIKTKNETCPNCRHCSHCEECRNNCKNQSQDVSSKALSNVKQSAGENPDTQTPPTNPLPVGELESSERTLRNNSVLQAPKKDKTAENNSPMGNHPKLQKSERDRVEKSRPTLADDSDNFNLSSKSFVAGIKNQRDYLAYDLFYREDIKEFLRRLDLAIEKTLNEGVKRNEVLPLDWALDRIREEIKTLAGDELLK